MAKKYEPAVFQPTIRPSWAGALEYVPNDELAQILKAITVFPSVDLPDSVFWNKTIKPDLEQQYQKFLIVCDARGRGARTYWGEHKLSTSLSKGNLCKVQDKVQDKVKVKVEDFAINSDIRNTRDNKSDIPTLEEFLDYAKQQNDMAGVGGFLCSPEIASACYDYYATNGWRRANKENTPVRDWKSALRAWARKENQNNDSQKRSF